MRILAFDPGALTGWALFELRTGAKPRDAILVACGLKSPQAPMPAPQQAIEKVYSERPKYYPHSKVPARDLITLAIRAGECMGPYLLAGADVHYYEPWEWKGSIDKKIHHPRLWGALSPNEQELVGMSLKGIAPSKRNNVMDGIGIGLFALGRVSVNGVALGRAA